MITLDEIKPLVFAVDTVDVSGSEVSLDAATLAALETITVAGITADVNIADGGNSITVDGEVELGATTLAALENVVVSGEVELGATTLAALESVTVQNGAGGAAVNIQDGGNSITVDGEVELGAASLAALENITVTEGGFSSWKSTAHPATSTSSQIAATPLTSRVSITIQNLGSADVYIGQVTGVTIATGTKIAKFSSFSEKLAAGADIWVITASGTADLRISEFAV
jgi:hypothetical protein